MSESLTPGLSFQAILLISAIVGSIVFHSWRLWSRRQWFCFDPLNTFWAGIIVVFVLQPLKYGDTCNSWHIPGTMEKALLWAVVSVAAVSLGHNAKLGAEWGYRLPRMPSRLDPGKVYIAALVLIAVGILGYGILMATAGGIKEWLAVGRGATDFEKLKVGYVRWLPHALPAGVALLLFHVGFHRVSSTLRAMVLIAATLTLLWTMYLGSRGGTIGFAIAWLAATYLPLRRNPPVWLTALVCVGLFVVVSFQAQYRANFTNLSFNLHQVDMKAFLSDLLPGVAPKASAEVERTVSASSEFNCVMAAVELVPRTIPYNHGYALLELLTHPIPRAIWPEKHYPHYEAFTPIMFQGGLSSNWQTVGSTEMLSGPGFTFVGHWYAIGGPIALVIAGLFTGALLRMLRTVYDRNPSSEGDAILFSQCVFVGFCEAATTPLFFIFTLPAMWIPTIILLFWARKDLFPNGRPVGHSAVHETREPVFRRGRKPPRLSNRSQNIGEQIH